LRATASVSAVDPGTAFASAAAIAVTSLAYRLA
jgi:hypothetical protein